VRTKLSIDDALDRAPGHPRPACPRELADAIIEAQVREIAEMKQLIADLETEPCPARRDGPATGQYAR